MKIVILGDIHANLPALEGALRAADAEGFDAILHSGDVVGFGPHPDEVVDLLAERGIEGVRGNHDEAVAAGETAPVAPLMDERSLELAAETIGWTSRRVSLRALKYLTDLPFERRLAAGPDRLALYHANPFDMTTYLQPGTPGPRLEACAEAAEAEVVVVGHAHVPFDRELPARRVVGAGSVGAPRDGDPRGAYAVVHLGGAIRVSHRRFEYDVERTVADALAAGLSESLADWWRRGR